MMILIRWVLIVKDGDLNKGKIVVHYENFYIYFPINFLHFLSFLPGYEIISIIFSWSLSKSALRITSFPLLRRKDLLPHHGNF